MGGVSLQAEPTHDGCVRLPLGERASLDNIVYLPEKKKGKAGGLVSSRHFHRPGEPAMRMKIMPHKYPVSDPLEF